VEGADEPRKLTASDGSASGPAWSPDSATVAFFATPPLILHREQDHRCPIEQGEQLYTALHLRGIPTRFVRFPDESHGMSRNGKPAHRLQRLDEIINWYDRFLRSDREQAGTA